LIWNTNTVVLSINFTRMNMPTPKKRNRKAGLVPARKQPLFRELQATLKREDFANCLYLTGNDRADRLRDMMLDPTYDHLSFGQLCSRAGLSAGDVTRLYCQRQALIGQILMAQHLPQIMEDVAISALNRDEPCSQCEGAGNLNGTRCISCGGAGQVRVMGDIEAIRLVLKVHGLIR